MTGWNDRLRALDQRVFDGDKWYGRLNKRIEARGQGQVDWVARHHLLVLTLCAIGIALVVVFGRR